MSNFIADDLARAMALVEKSKGVIESMATKIADYEKTIATHVETITGLTSTASAVSTVVSDFHTRMTEFESFLDRWIVKPVENVVEAVEEAVTPASVEVLFGHSRVYTVESANVVFSNNEPVVEKTHTFGDTVSHIIETAEQVLITPFK